MRSHAQAWRRPHRGHPHQRSGPGTRIRPAHARMPHHLELPELPWRRGRHLQRHRTVPDLGLRLLRRQLRVRQRSGSQSSQHQAHRSEEQQHAVVQDSGQDLLRAERHQVSARHVRHRKGRHRVRQGHGAARRGRQDHRPAARTFQPRDLPHHRLRRAGAERRNRRTRCRHDAQGVRTGHHHRRRRWFPDGRLQDHVAAVRAPGDLLLRRAREVLRHP